MGKAAMCIKMLQILNSGRVYKISELATLLDTNSRNIIEYKKELDECGYYINTIPGRNGGYQINNTFLMPTLKLTEDEYDTLKDSTNYLLSRNDFFHKDELESIMGKVYSTVNKYRSEDHLTIIYRFPISMESDELKKRMNLIEDAISAKKVIRVKYISQKNFINEYNYHPYELFMYNNTWFVIGWSEKYCDILYLKVNRFMSIELTDQTFKVYKLYNKSNYINEFGFKNNGEWYHVEFIAKDIYASIIKERTYGKNQQIEEIDNKHTLVKVDMQNKDDIIRFIIKHTNYIDVIEPEWLKDALVNISQNIIDKYKKDDN